MNEKDISKIVETVITQLKGNDVKMNLILARRLIHTVEKKAKEIGVNAVVAICDAGARTVAVECMDDSYIASYDIAVNKAFTCAALKMSTSKLKALSQPGESLYGIQFTNEGKIVIIGGGDPLWISDKLIGAIGVSGGTEEQDTFLSAYGAEKLKELI